MATCNTSTPCSTRHPSLVQLSEIFHKKHRFTAEAVERGNTLFGPSWADDFELILGSMFPTAESLEAAAKGYASFALNSMRLQAAFVRDGVYAKTTHATASANVYFNEHYMLEEYLPGLLLSHFLWPHHYRQLRFFDLAFVESMHLSGVKSFLEVGVGTGIYSGRVLRKIPAIRGRGTDISKSSKRFAEMQMSALGVSDRFQVDLIDITKEATETHDWLICVEVLEHLDDPLAFLRDLRKILSPGAKAFITAAVNAAHLDHVYLYSSADQVLRQLLEAGFHLEQGFIAHAYKPTSPGAPVPEAAAFIVF